MTREYAESLILEHLGVGWEVAEPDVLAVRVLLDRLQDEGLSLPDAVRMVADVHWEGARWRDDYLLCFGRFWPVVERAVEASGLASS